MEYAELTGSRTKPLPAHSPWSGGSKRRLKLVTSLSRLLTPLKFSSTEPAAADSAVDARAGERARQGRMRATGRCRAPFDRTTVGWVAVRDARTWTCGARPRVADR